MTLMRSHVPQMAAPTPHDDACEGYRDLVIAIVKQAVQDATGPVLAPGPVSPAPVRAEALAWLQDETAGADLLALAGYDAALVLPRLRRLRAEHRPQPQPSLFCMEAP
jgi:hypothetical protein